jgi:hypothetical protein
VFSFFIITHIGQYDVHFVSRVSINGHPVRSVVIFQSHWETKAQLLALVNVEWVFLVVSVNGQVKALNIFFIRQIFKNNLLPQSLITASIIEVEHVA